MVTEINHGDETITPMPNLKFLIIEDDLFYRKYLNDLLAQTGVTILSASDGEEGLQIALAEKPDLILSDIEIPKIQGFVLLRTLKEHTKTKDIPVILMSGKVERDLLERLSKLKIRSDGYLIKPFSAQELMKQIKRVLGSRGLPGPGERVFEQEEKGVPEVSTDVGEGSINVHEKILSSQNRPKASGRVFVVDDSEYILDSVSQYLGEIGLEVHRYSNGEEALKAAFRIKPDLLLVDVQMPGISGFVVCEMLRKEESTREIPIILMSGVVDGGTFERHSRLKYHAHAYLVKPFMKSELQDLVLEFLGSGTQKRTALAEKAGFLVPSEEEIFLEEGGAAQGPGPRGKEEPSGDWGKARKTIEDLKTEQTQLSSRLLEALSQKDHLEEELFNLRASKESREKELQDKLSLVTGRFEKAREDLENLTEQLRQAEKARSELEAEHRGFLEKSGFPEEKLRKLTQDNEELKRDFQAALLAKAEIEDQVDIYFKNRREAEEKGTKALTERLEKVQKELENLRKENLEEKESSEAEKASLRKTLSESVRKVESLEGERDLRVRAETEIQLLREKVAELERSRTRFDELQEKCLILEGKMEESEKVRRELKRELEQRGSGGEESREETALLNQRLKKLETTFSQTVLEAQEIITSQKDRENELREKLDTIFRSLEEEKRNFREERENWRKKEEELRSSFEDALAENRRILGEEASRYFPMRVPRQTRPLEVVTTTRKLISAMIWAVVFLLVFFSGFLVLSRFTGRDSRQTLVPDHHFERVFHIPGKTVLSGVSEGPFPGVGHQRS